MSYKDTLQKFLFEKTPVRGELVHLDSAWHAILERHEYPAQVRKVLGEMVAAAVLLSATLKLNGRLVIQLRGNGPINLMMVECANSHEIRGLAHWQDLPDEHDLQSLFGDGTLVITLEPREEQTQYQSVVEIVGSTLAEALSNYLKQSEQLETDLWLAANEESATGLLIQKLPDDTDIVKIENMDNDAWNRIHHLSSTLTGEELLSLSMMDILHRLYHEEQVRIFEPSPICFRCSCSNNRVVSMIRGLGYDEAKSIVAEKGAIYVACEFCNQKYDFDQVDVEEIFATEISHNPNKTRH